MSSAYSSTALKVALVAGSLIVTFVMLAALEGGLRLVGLGNEDASGASRLEYQQVFPPMLRASYRADGTPVLATADVRLPYQTIAAEKGEGTLRVFTFGGSATAGLGYGPNVTFTRHLERMLERAYPDRSIEIVNLGVVALASRQVKVLVEDACRRYAPDAIVVYSGNNEFLEIHAEKFAATQANFLSRVLSALKGTNLYRLADRAIKGPARPPSLADQALSNEDLRLSQQAIIEHIEMTPDEIAEVIDRYEANIDAIAAIAAQTSTPLVLMTVASNWRYRGRHDLPANWLEQVLGEPGVPSAERYHAAMEKLDVVIASGSALEAWEALYRRATAEEALGDTSSARASYRLAMNRDPHLRRALDSMADRVRDVARRRAVPLLDAIALLEQQAEAGIIGFDEFYDYVHFTPRGALLLGTALFGELVRTGVAPNNPQIDPDQYRADRLARLETIHSDPLDREEWMGIGFDVSRIADRDLWKYERMLEDLDRRIETDPSDFVARVYRGNARASMLTGFADAQLDYKSALALKPGHAVTRRNLSTALAERPSADLRF